MRIAFLGTPNFAVAPLAALHAAGHELVRVIAQPDRPSGRGNKLQVPPTIVWAREHGIPTSQPTRVRSGEFVTEMTSSHLDLAVVVAYGRILTPEVLAGPRLGCINVHASLLPRWRGAAPIQWALLSGDTETGVCCQQMAAGLDTGDILSEARTQIGPEEDHEQLASRLSAMSAPLIVDTVARLSELKVAPQDEARVTYARILQKEDGRLHFELPAATLHARIRGLRGWPGAFTSFRGELLKVHSVSVLPGAPAGLAPGTLLPGGRVVCGDGMLHLREVQLPGRKAVSGLDFYNGARVAPGERLGENSEAPAEDPR